MTPEEEADYAADLAAEALAKWRKGKPTPRGGKPKWDTINVDFKQGEAKEAAAVLVSKVKAKRWARFKALSLPEGGAYASIAVSGKVRVRAVCQYKIETDESLLRIDVMGALA